MQRVLFHVAVSSLAFMMLFAVVEAWRLAGRERSAEGARFAAEPPRSGCRERRARPTVWAGGASARYTFRRVSERPVARPGADSSVERVYVADDGKRVVHRVERFASPERFARALASHADGASFPIETRPGVAAGGRETGSRRMLFYGFPQVRENWFELVWTDDGATLETVEGPTYVHASQFDRALRSGEID